MAYDPEQRRRALQYFLDTFGLSARKLSTAAKLSPSAAGQFLNGKSRSLTDETYELFAQGASELLGWQVPPALLRGEASYAIPLHDMSHMVSETLPTPGIDIAKYPRTNEFVIHWDRIVAWLPRPPAIEGRFDIFGIYAVDDFMSPWRETGDVIYAEKNRRAKIGDYIIVEQNDHVTIDKKSHPISYLGRLVDRDVSSLTLRRFTDGWEMKEIKVPRVQILAAHKVIDWAELLLGDDQSAIKWTGRPTM